MELETLFQTDDINEIYDYITIYSILKYNELPIEIQEVFEKLYKKTIKNFKERGLDTNKLNHYKIDFIIDRLNGYKSIYETNILLNRNIIEEIAQKVQQLIIVPLQDKDELTKINFLFEFITNYINYSEEYFKYCLDVPLVDNYLFDFKNNIPVDSSIFGLLVQRQGICDDISNLIIYLGKKLNLNVNKVICNYNNSLHSLNSITLSNGQNYLLDATRVIRGDKTKEESFLVSSSTLNKDKNYEFKEDMITTEDYKENIPSFKKEVLLLIEKINELLPKEIDINQKKNRQ